MNRHKKGAKYLNAVGNYMMMKNQFINMIRGKEFYIIFYNLEIYPLFWFMKNYLKVIWTWLKVNYLIIKLEI